MIPKDLNENIFFRTCLRGDEQARVVRALAVVPLLYAVCLAALTAVELYALPLDLPPVGWLMQIVTMVLYAVCAVAGCGGADLLIARQEDISRQIMMTGVSPTEWLIGLSSQRLHKVFAVTAIHLPLFVLNVQLGGVSMGSALLTVVVLLWSGCSLIVFVQTMIRAPATGLLVFLLWGAAMALGVTLATGSWHHSPHMMWAASLAPALALCRLNGFGQANGAPILAAAAFLVANGGVLGLLLWRVVFAVRESRVPRAEQVGLPGGGRERQKPVELSMDVGLHSQDWRFQENLTGWAHRHQELGWHLGSLGTMLLFLLPLAVGLVLHGDKDLREWTVGSAVAALLVTAGMLGPPLTLRVDWVHRPPPALAAAKRLVRWFTAVKLAALLLVTWAATVAIGAFHPSLPITPWALLLAVSCLALVSLSAARLVAWRPSATGETEFLVFLLGMLWCGLPFICGAVAKHLLGVDPSVMRGFSPAYLACLAVTHTRAEVLRVAGFTVVAACLLLTALLSFLHWRVLRRETW